MVENEYAEMGVRPVTKPLASTPWWCDSEAAFGCRFWWLKWCGWYALRMPALVLYGCCSSWMKADFEVLTRDEPLSTSWCREVGGPFTLKCCWWCGCWLSNESPAAILGLTPRALLKLTENKLSNSSDKCSRSTRKFKGYLRWEVWKELKQSNASLLEGYIL